MRCSRQLYQNLLLHLEFVMASVCKICAGPIEPLDQHLHCVACLGLAHAEAALDESDCGHCADLPVRVLRARRDVVRGLFGVGLTAASVPLVSPPSPGGGSAVLPCRRTQRSPHSPISFPEDCFRPPSNIEGFVAFGHEEGDEAMSISASEKDGWAGSEPEQLGSSEPSGLQEELMRVLSKAVQELELTWNPPEEPVRSKLDSWYFRSTRKADARTSVPFFPDVHEQLVKTWSAPQSARVHSNTQAMFSHVDGAEAHGYVRSPPVEETVAAHLCPAAAKSLGPDISLPSKPCRTTAHLANKAYDGEAASALHAMAVLQVFQAKLLQTAEGGVLTPEATKDLRAATDFALMATKRAAQSVGKAMGFMVVLQRHLWLNLADLKDADRKVLLNAPISPSGLFGDAVETITERFAETQKRAKAMSHVMPRRAPQQQTARSRSSSAHGSAQRRDFPRPAQAEATATAPRQEPDVRRKVWGSGRKRQGQRRSPRRDSRPPPAAKPLPDDRREGGERESSPAPKRPKFSCSNVCVLSVHSIKMHTFSQKELSPPHSINAAPLAPPQCSAGPHPTQVIAAHPTTEPLKPLRQFISAWKVIPGISRWLLNMIERGYTLQFRRRPSRFNGVVQSLTSPRNAQALRQEIGCLLEKGAVERVPPHELESGFYSRYFVVPKRDGGLRPILDLRPINRALCERPFRMLTLKQILAQIRPGDWFASVDLKDAYFHIQIAPHHRRFLRFAFESTAYQYSVLPFGLALAPRTFSKCVDAALSPLRASGMRILNYLDDWLILAQSRDTLLSHIDSLLIHLESLGLCVNRRKSILAPSQSILYLGVCMDSLEMRARLSRERVAAILSYLRHFREGSSVHLKEFQRLLGLMASASAVCHLGLLHMRPLQLWLKTRVPWTAWTSGRLSIAVTRGCIEALAPWRNPNFFSRGVPLGLVTSRVVVTTDASTLGWGAVCEGMPASGQWSEPQIRWHINRLELEAVFLALKEFQAQLERQHVLIRTDNTSVVSYINRQGGVRSKALCKQAAMLLLWADSRLLSIRATHIPGLLNRGADMLSRRRIPQGEWRLHPESVRMIWNLYGEAEVDLFATSENAHCPSFFSLSHSPLEGDALTARWPTARLYAFPPIKILPLVLCKIREERASVILIAPNWPNQPWFPDLTELLIAPPWPIPVRKDMLSQVDGSVWHPNPELWNLHVWLLQGCQGS